MLHIKLNIQRFAVSASVSYSVQNQDPATNTSVVRITFTVKRTSGSTYWSDGKTLTFTCDGQTGTKSFSFPSGSVGYTKSAYYDFIVTHNNDGTKYIEFGARIVTGTSAGTLNPTGDANLPTIPRYTTTTNLNIVSRTETSFTVSWSTANACSQIRYGTSTSNYTTINVSGSSGQFTISGLNVNTQYTLTFMPKRSDSGLWGDGSDNAWGYIHNQYTYDYPKVYDIKDIILKPSTEDINTLLWINFYNPLEKYFDYEIISDVDSSVIYGETNVNMGAVGIPLDNEMLTAFYETIPNAQYGTYHVNVYYDNNTRTSDSKRYTIDADTCRPTMSVVGYEDINAKTLALTNDNQKLVVGYSNIQVIVADGNKATAKYGASITGYIIKNGTNQSELVPEEDGEDVVLTIGATSGIIEVYAVDSRGQSGLYQIVNTTMINYTPIAKNQNPIAERTDDQGHPNGVGEYVKITLRGTFWNNSFGYKNNSIKNITYEYVNAKTPGTPTQGTTTVTATTTNNSYLVSQLILGDTQHGFNIDNSYIINVTVGDELSTTTFTMTIGSGTPHIAYSPNGVSIMGKYNETAGGLFQVAGNPLEMPIINNSYSTATDETYACDYVNAKFGGLLDIFYPVGSYYETSNTNFNPNTAWGGTWVEDTPGRFTLATGVVQANTDNFFGALSGRSWNAGVGSKGGQDYSSNPLSDSGWSKIQIRSSNQIQYHEVAVGQSNYWATNYKVNGTSAGSSSETGYYGAGLGGNTDLGNNMPPYICVKRWHRTA